MKKMHPFEFVLIALSAAFIVCAVPQSLKAQGVPPKKIALVVGYGPGGGFDDYARLTGKYIEKYFPGNPIVIVQNMPGAGGIKALNWLAESAPRDGSAMSTLSGSAVFAPLQGLSGATFDATRFNYLISLDRLSNFLLVWHTTPFTSARDAFDEQIIIANTPGASAIMPVIYNRLIGTKFKVVTGYSGTNELLLALERGEGDGVFNLSWSSIISHPRLLKENLVRVLLQLTFNPIDDPRLAGVPSLTDYVKAGIERDMLEILLAKDELGRPIIAPPDMPADLVRIYRENLVKAAQAPEFLAEAKERQMPVMVQAGESVEAYVKRIYAMPESTVKRLQGEIKIATEEGSKKSP